MAWQYLLTVTALAEAGIGLLLLSLPGVVLDLLLGVLSAAPEALFVGRVAGAALLAIGVTCWLARGDREGPARRGVIAGVLTYDVAASGLLAYAGVGLGLTGPVLWPGVAFHAVMAVWCLALVRRGGRFGR
jgi:hypothetical protein